MATFLPSPMGMPPELLEGYYMSGKVPSPDVVKAPKLPGATYEGTASKVKGKSVSKPHRFSSTNAVIPEPKPKRLPPPKGAVPRGRPMMGGGGAMTALSLLAGAQPQGTVGSPFIASPVGVTPEQMQQQVVPQAREQLAQRAARSPVATPSVPKAAQTRTPQVPQQVQQQVKNDVEAGKVTGDDYVQAAVQKANMDKVSRTGTTLTKKEEEAVKEKEGSFWNQLGIDGKTAALIGVGLAATAAGYGKGGFERGVGQGFNMMQQALGARDARAASAARQSMAEEQLKLDREKLDIMRARLAAKDKAAGKPKSVASKQTMPQIETAVEEVMASQGIEPESGPFGMFGGDMSEEDYLKYKRYYSDYVFQKRQEGDTRSTVDILSDLGQ